MTLTKINSSPPVHSNKMKPVFKLYALLAGVGGIALLLSLFTALPSPCIIYLLIGIPCPACGLTRAFISLARLDIRQAFHYHPLFFMVPLLPLAMYKKIPPNRQNFIFIVLITVFIAVWAVRMIVLFPDTAPMNMNDDAVMIELIRQIRGG